VSWERNKIGRMRYFVIGPDGAQYGPADITLLQQWVREGRVTPATSLVEEGSLRPLRASEIPGLFGTSPGAPSSPWATAPSPYPRAGAPASSRAGESNVVASYVFSALGLAFVIPILGPLIGLFLAQRAQNLGHPGAKAAFIFSVICLGLNLLGCLACAALWGTFMTLAP
jgi:hypothetical protein